MRMSQIETLASGCRVKLEYDYKGDQLLSVNLHIFEPTRYELLELRLLQQRTNAELGIERADSIAHHLLQVMITEHEPDHLALDLLAAMSEFDQKYGTDLMTKLSARFWELNGGHQKSTRLS